MTDDSILDDPFHFSAWAAYLDQMAIGGTCPPDREATRVRPLTAITNKPSPKRTAGVG